MSTASGPKPSLFTAHGNGINLLSLDAGGTHGVAELRILKAFMENVQFTMGEEYANVRLRPCDIFHLIGGSGTGGLIAILLGRLGLTVDEAISCYEEISRNCFSSGFKDTAQMSTDLERVMKDIVKAHGAKNDEDESMEYMTVTKTFVLSRAGNSFSSNMPHTFRTYKVRSNRGPSCKIWEAVRATTALKGVFTDIAVGHPIPITYSGTSTQSHNPSQTVVEEARVHFPNKEIGAIVSIGAGRPGPLLSTVGQLSGPELEVQKSLEQIHRDCVTTNEYFARHASIDPVLEDRVWRFAVEHGLNGCKLNDADSSYEIGQHFKHYLQQYAVENSMKYLVDGIVSRITNSQ